MKKIINYWQSILYFGIMLVKDCYYRLQLVPQNDGSKRPVLSRISRAQVHDDYTKQQRKSIKRFSGFGVFPQNIDYQQSVEDYYNLYAPPSVVPEKGTWDNTRTFLQHLFGEYYPLVLDYLYLLYLKPTQRLPVIILISEDRETGKTTFLDWLAAWFGDNCVIATNATFRNRFNSSWAGKLIVGIDESLLQRRSDSERIKALATSERVEVERKGQEIVYMPNISHLILACNNLWDPILIDKKENRYFVRETPPLKQKKQNFKEMIINELPAFSHYLAYEHQMTYPEAQSRLWFPPEAYETEALARIKGASVMPDQQVVATSLLDILDEIGKDTIAMTHTELNAVLMARGLRVNLASVLRSWSTEVTQEVGKMYDAYFTSDGTLRDTPARCKGRFYVFTREFLERHV